MMISDICVSRSLRELLTEAVRTPPADSLAVGDEMPPNMLPIDTRVMVAGLRGRVVGCNRSNSGFYPGSRYPYIVQREDGVREVYAISEINVL